MYIEAFKNLNITDLKRILECFKEVVSKIANNDNIDFDEILLKLGGNSICSHDLVKIIINECPHFKWEELTVTSESDKEYTISCLRCSHSETCIKYNVLSRTISMLLDILMKLDNNLTQIWNMYAFIDSTWI